MAEAVRVLLTAHDPDAEGRMWVTAQVNEGETSDIGYLRPNGDGIAAHGPDEGWPQVAVCANAARALGALMADFGRHLADCIDSEEMMEG